MITALSILILSAWICAILVLIRRMQKQIAALLEFHMIQLRADCLKLSSDAFLARIRVENPELFNAESQND